MNPLFSVVVVAGDAGEGLRLAMALQPIPGVHVATIDPDEDVLAAVELHDALVVVADASLVAQDGRRVEALRAARDAVGFVIVTEQPSLHDAVLALRARVDEFFPGDVSDERLRTAVESLAVAVRRRLGPGPGRPVLVVGSSLEAVLLGAGGAIRMHADAGDHVVVATLDAAVDGDRRSAREAVADRIGATIVPFAAPGASGDEMRAALAPLVAEHDPAVVYTHSATDEAAAQRRVHRAVAEALPDASRLSCFQSARSSIDFAPTLFVDIDAALEHKVAALQAWSHDAGAIDLVRANAVYWSRFGTGRACEPFELLRDAVETRSPSAVEEAARAVAPAQPA